MGSLIWYSFRQNKSLPAFRLPSARNCLMLLCTESFTWRRRWFIYQHVPQKTSPIRPTALVPLIIKIHTVLIWNRMFVVLFDADRIYSFYIHNLFPPSSRWFLGKVSSSDRPNWNHEFLWPSFAIQALMGKSYPISLEIALYLGFLIAYAVKLPIFTLHTWLPDTHGEAHYSTCMLLAGLGYY